MKTYVIDSGPKPDLQAALRKQRGVAVITALLLTTLAITVVASLFWQQQVQVRSIENQRLQLQKQWILRGALDWASLILREDAKHSSVDDLNEPWAVPLAETRLDQYVEKDRVDGDISDASLSGSISDAQARYNLNNLTTNGMVNPAEVSSLQRLLSNAQLDPALAQATADIMAASMTKPSNATDPQPMMLTQLNDLLAVPGFTPEALDKLKALVIFLPPTAQVNVNTASAEVLAAIISTLSLADATALIASRESASFRDISDFSNRLQGKPIAAPANKLSVTTQYFLVNGKVRLHRAGQEVLALVERKNSTTKIIWIQEY